MQKLIVALIFSFSFSVAWAQNEGALYLAEWDKLHVASVPTAGDMDDMFYNSGRKRIYVAGGEGFLSVVQQVDADHYTDMGKFPRALGTRTGVWYEKRQTD